MGDTAGPLAVAERISDPVSFVHLKRDGKHIVLLADVHSDNSSGCADCTEPSCLNYISLIESLDKYTQKEGLDYDVFLEMFAVGGTEQRKKQIQHDREFRKATRRAGHRLRILNARNAFAKKVYMHGRKGPQRYHYADARFYPMLRLYGFFMELVADPQQKLLDEYYVIFQLMYPRKEKLIDTILDLCFSNNLSSIFPLPEKRTKIAKQVSKLPESEQRLLRRVIELVVRRVLHLYDYHNKNEFPRAFFGMTSVFMDTYLLARFLYYFRQQKAGGYTVVLSGAAHTAIYMEFFKRWGTTVETIANPKVLETIRKKQIDDTTLLGEPHCVSVGKTRRRGRR